MSDRILIVDSDCLACELLQFKFEDEGFKVDVEHDCNAAMQRPLSDYNLLLVDMMDSDFDGIRFTRMVRDNSETAKHPIILLTAKASEDNIVSGLDAGADDFI
ncbi:MAG: response regulator, partial [Paramuribaculum sp.]|nr:response regulator [Paramuribaculum sp.]